MIAGARREAVGFPTGHFDEHCVRTAAIAGASLQEPDRQQPAMPKPAMPTWSRTRTPHDFRPGPATLSLGKRVGTPFVRDPVRPLEARGFTAADIRFPGLRATSSADR